MTNRVLYLSLLVILFVASFAYQVVCISHNPSFLDVGYIVNASYRIAQGQVPYRDFFSLITPLHFLLFALPVVVFGNRLSVMLVGGALVCAIACVLVYLIGRQVLSHGFSLFAFLLSNVYGLAFVGVVPAYAWTAYAFSLGSVLCALRGVTDDRRRWMVAAGALAACAFWTKQTLGVTIAFAILLGDRSVKKATAFMVGVTAVSAPMILWLGWSKALVPMIQDTVWLPFNSFMSEAKVSPPSIAAVGIATEDQIAASIYWAVLGALAMCLVASFLSRRWGVIQVGRSCCWPPSRCS